MDVCQRYDGRRSGRKSPKCGLALHVVRGCLCPFRRVGRTATSAIDKAIASALDRIKDRFNAAELESVSVSKYLGFRVAKITLYARQIQQQASLSLVDEMTIRQLTAL